MLDFIHFCASENDVWLAAVGQCVLPSLYKSYEALLCSFRNELEPRQEKQTSSRRTSLQISWDLQQSVPALRVLSRILDISVDCCDLNETFAGKRLLNFVRAASAILIGSNFSTRIEERSDEALYQCDAIRRNAAFSLANIVHTSMSCREEAVKLYQTRHAHLMNVIQQAPEISIQRSLLRLSRLLYDHKLSSGEGNKFRERMGNFLSVIKDETSPGKSKSVGDHFEDIDLGAEDAANSVERFRILLCNLAWQEDSPAVLSSVMNSCHVYLGKTARKKDGAHSLAEIDWNMRGIAIKSADYINGAPIYFPFSQMGNLNLCSGATEFEFAPLSSDFKMVSIHLSSSSSRHMFTETLLPRLTGEVGLSVSGTGNLTSKKKRCQDTEVPRILSKKRKKSIPAKDLDMSSFVLSSDHIGEFSDSTGEKALQDTAVVSPSPSSTHDKPSDEPGNCITKAIESVFSGLEPDGVLMLPTLSTDPEEQKNEKCANKQAKNAPLANVPVGSCGLKKEAKKLHAPLACYTDQTSIQRTEICLPMEQCLPRDVRGSATQELQESGRNIMPQLISSRNIESTERKVCPAKERIREKKPSGLDMIPNIMHPKEIAENLPEENAKKAPPCKTHVLTRISGKKALGTLKNATMTQQEGHQKHFQHVRELHETMQHRDEDMSSGQVGANNDWGPHICGNTQQSPGSNANLSSSSSLSFEKTTKETELTNGNESLGTRGRARRESSKKRSMLREHEIQSDSVIEKASPIEHHVGSKCVSSESQSSCDLSEENHIGVEKGTSSVLKTASLENVKRAGKMRSSDMSYEESPVALSEEKPSDDECASAAGAFCDNAGESIDDGLESDLMKKVVAVLTGVLARRKVRTSQLWSQANHELQRLVKNGKTQEINVASTLHKRKLKLKTEYAGRLMKVQKRLRSAVDRASEGLRKAQKAHQQLETDTGKLLARQRKQVQAADKEWNGRGKMLKEFVNNELRERASRLKKESTKSASLMADISNLMTTSV